MILSLWLGFLRGLFLANHLASTDNFTRTTKRQNTYQHKLTIQKKLITTQSKNNTKRMIDRA